MNASPQRKDVVIIGGGIAGLTAAMNTSMMALDTTVIQKTPFMGQIPESVKRENYPGIRNVTGEVLAQNIQEQVEKDFSVEIKREEVVDIILNTGDVPYRFLVKTGHEHYLARSIILATGSRPSSLPFGETSLHGISYFPVFDSQEFEGKQMVIVGVRDSTVQFTSWLLPIAGSITIIDDPTVPGNTSPRKKKELDALIRENDERITLISGRSVKELCGDGHVEEIVVVDPITGEENILSAESIIICSERIPNSELAVKIGCDVDANGFVIVDREQKTTIPGLFAAGDVAGVVMSAIKSAGEGCVSGMKAAEFLGSGNW